MAELSPNLPRAEAGDAAEVAAALETARALWSNGQGLESVRWIQRAAENAESSGNDLRAVTLARAAADLRAEFSVGSEPPGRMNEAAALTPYDDFSESTIVDSPASSLARASLQIGVQIAEAPVGPATKSSVMLVSPPAPAVAPGRVAQHQAVRVAIISGDPTTRHLSVQVLGEGESAPAGSTEALLVSLDPQRKLLV
ncbi:MAG TPA: hypothetical protein VHP33_28760 [Polyangiaceae bacterium]|nr:hypothetical protein [Polyangiaceae bacterium]